MQFHCSTIVACNWILNARHKGLYLGFELDTADLEFRWCRNISQSMDNNEKWNGGLVILQFSAHELDELRSLRISKTRSKSH
jgi:hypothetical protein